MKRCNTKCNTKHINHYKYGIYSEIFESSSLFFRINPVTHVVAGFLFFPRKYAGCFISVLSESFGNVRIRAAFYNTTQHETHPAAAAENAY